MYGIDEKVYAKLIEYFQCNKDIMQVTLFGSRAKGLERFNSDIDICIQYRGVHKGTLVFELEACAGIYSLDIVFEGCINESLESQIKRDGIIIYYHE